jgi:hypothetical protein
MNMDNIFEISLIAVCAMKTSVIFISVDIPGTVYANIAYIHYLRNVTFQLEVSENSDVIAFLWKSQWTRQSIHDTCL